MKRFGSFKTAAGVVVLGVLIAAVVAVATAQAAPSKKNFTLQVAVTKPASGPVDPQNFTITLKNDGSSNTTLGSANISPPAGFTFDTDPAKTTTGRAGWTATVVGNVLQLRSSSSTVALAAGQAITANVRVASPTLPTNCGSAAWSVLVKQSNDFNGTNNWFTLLGAGSDLTPLGSFEIADIGTPIAVAPFFTPAILLQKYTSSTVAYDSCHNVKGNYSGAGLTHHGLTGATISPATSLNWGSGTGSVDITPAVSETNNTITVTDPTTGIGDTSNLFDTQQKICTFADPDACAWQNGNGSIKANSAKPLTGSLGVGFDPVANVTWDCGGNPLGNTVITISPHDTPNGDYQVTLVYSKQVSGSGSANAFVVCESKDNGASFHQLPACSTLSANPLPDCVVDQKRITGGALQIILNLQPGDPYVGGR